MRAGSLLGGWAALHRTWAHTLALPSRVKTWASHLPTPRLLQGAVPTDVPWLGAESSVLRAHIPALDFLPDPWDWSVPPWLLLMLPASGCGLPSPILPGVTAPLHQSAPSAQAASRASSKQRPWEGPMGRDRSHHYHLPRSPVVITKAESKCPRRKEPFNGGSLGLGRHEVGGEAQPRKKAPICF